MPILEIKKFKKTFNGIPVVNGISIDIEKGKITGIIGPNGSGKSTLVNLITGVIKKDEGAVVLSDDVKIEKIFAHDMFSYKITRTFQNVRLFEQMTVLDNLLVVLTKRSLWASLFETNKALYEDRAHDILKMLGIEEKKNNLASTLSYGQRKLLEIGRVIAMDADIIFFDEPYAGLFPEMVKKVSEIIKQLKSEGRAIVLIEHNMELIKELCDHVFVMDAGTLLAEGAPEKVLKKEEVVEAYLGR